MTVNTRLGAFKFWFIFCIVSAHELTTISDANSYATHTATLILITSEKLWLPEHLGDNFKYVSELLIMVSGFHFFRLLCL